MSQGLNNFELVEGEEVEATLERYEKHLQERTSKHLGYPYNLTYTHQDRLLPLLSYSINNLGDPFVSSNYGVHSRAFELSVLEYFAELWSLPWEEAWGYVTCSGTEGNLHAMWVAREVLPQAPVYASVETHYSIAKACRMYRTELRTVKTLPTGETDYEDLERSLKAARDQGYFSAIINLNVGTTVKGGVDNCERVVELLHRLGFSDDQFFIHVDSALFGMLLPHLPEFSDSPHLSFDLPISSISVSGHKMIGSPVPCGVVLHRKENIKKIEREVEYLASTDTCIMGSRNGHAAVYMWHTIQVKGTAGFEADAKLCIENAKFLVSKLRGNGIGCLLNPLSNTVVLERPMSDEFVLDWQLACTGTIAHVVVMPSTGKDKLQLFAEEFMRQFEAHESKHRCIKTHVGPNWCLCNECNKN